MSNDLFPPSGIFPPPPIMPIGTVVLFQQTAAPLGWTKITTNDNAALRIVAGSASTGGSVGFTSAFSNQNTGATAPNTGGPSTNTSDGPNTNSSGAAAPLTGGPSTNTTDAHILSLAEMPSHNHAVSDPGHYHTVGVHARNGSGAQFSDSGDSLTYNGVAVNAATTGISLYSAGSDYGHTHTMGNHYHQTNWHTHDLQSHTHTMGNHYHGVASHTHSVNLQVAYVDVIAASKN